MIFDFVTWRSGASAGLDGVVVSAVNGWSAAEVLWRVRRGKATVRVAKMRAKVQLGQAMVGGCGRVNEYRPGMRCGREMNVEARKHCRLQSIAQ